MNEQNTFYIKILSPVHIGCDEVYEPAGFIVNEQTETFTAFDPLDFFRKLDDKNKDRYAEICRKGTIESIAELYKFMKNQQYDGLSVNLSKEFVKHYKESLAKSSRDFQRELNQFAIARTSFNPTTQKPYIPGSAVKGSLRTAYLNEVAKSKRITLDSRDKKPAETLEKGLLNYQKLENDPFRLLKVSDFHPIGPCTTKIIYAVNEKKEDSKFKARGPYQILEIIEPGAVFAGTIKVLSPLTREAIREPLTEKAVFNSAVTFYEKEKKLEDGEFNAAGITAFNLEKENDAYLLRLGRHSGAESITVEGYRHIKIMKKRGERPAYSDKATTFWLASDASTGYQKSQLRPFGWSALGKLTDELQATFKQLLTEQAAKSFPFSSGGMPGVQTEIRKPVQPALPVEEVWGNAFVAYNAGGPGKITAQVPGGKAAILQGRDKLKGAVAEVLHKKLFEGKKQVPKACVTVRKTGNSYEIISVEPTG